MKIPHMLPAPTHVQFPLRSKSLTRAGHRLQLTNPHWHHPKSTVYLRAHPWCCIIYGFGQRHYDMYPSSQYHSKFFFFFCYLKSPLWSACSSCPSPTMLTTGLFTIPTALPFSRMSLVGARHDTDFPEWPLSLAVHLRFLHVSSFPGAQLIRNPLSFIWNCQTLSSKEDPASWVPTSGEFLSSGTLTSIWRCQSSDSSQPNSVQWNLVVVLICISLMT